MIQLPRQRHSRLTTRFLILLAVTLGLMGQTGLGALGEIHELAEHPESIVVHAAHMQPHEHPTDSPSDEREAGKLVHDLVHHVHCGSHMTALPVDDFELPHLYSGASSPCANPTSRVIAAHSATPFRPPQAV